MSSDLLSGLLLGMSLVGSLWAWSWARKKARSLRLRWRRRLGLALAVGQGGLACLSILADGPEGPIVGAVAWGLEQALGPNPQLMALRWPLAVVVAATAGVLVGWYLDRKQRSR